MSGQRAHRRGSLGGRRVRGAAVRDLGFAFELLEGELELLDLQRELLRGLAKGHAAELRKLVAEGIDQRVAGRESGFELGDRSEERRVGKEGVSTGRSRWSQYQ